MDNNRDDPEDDTEDDLDLPGDSDYDDEYDNLPEGSADKDGLSNTDDEESFDQFLKRKKKSTLVRVGTRV